MKLNTCLENGDLNHVILVECVKITWYLLLIRLTMLEIYNNEHILSAQGIEVGNLTCYINNSYTLVNGTLKS